MLTTQNSHQSKQDRCRLSTTHKLRGERTAEVVAHVMDAEQLVVDQALNEVEGAPRGEQQAEVRTPTRGELTALPRPNGEQHRGGDENPCGQVEKAVDQRVRLQPARVSIGSPRCLVSMWCTGDCKSHRLRADPRRPAGRYEWTLRMLEQTGNGWKITVTFVIREK